MSKIKRAAEKCRSILRFDGIVEKKPHSGTPVRVWSYQNLLWAVTQIAVYNRSVGAIVESVGLTMTIGGAHKALLLQMDIVLNACTDQSALLHDSSMPELEGIDVVTVNPAIAESIYVDGSYLAIWQPTPQWDSRTPEQRTFMPLTEARRLTLVESTDSVVLQHESGCVIATVRVCDKSSEYIDGSEIGAHIRKLLFPKIP